MQTKEEYNSYMRHYLKLRHRRLMRYCKKKLGGKCVVCSSTKLLEFDHINPKDKSFEISNCTSVSKEKLDKELEKCQLLCEQHHFEKHAAKHGTLGGYRYCKCELCVGAKNKWWKQYKEKRANSLTGQANSS